MTKDEEDDQFIVMYLLSLYRKLYEISQQECRRYRQPMTSFAAVSLV